MTSLSLFPRPLALSAYSAVSGSRMTLCLAISCSALFACRSPPLLSLCLTVLPLEAGMGQAPHIAANDASDVFRQVKVGKYVCRISTPSC